MQQLTLSDALDLHNDLLNRIKTGNMEIKLLIENGDKATTIRFCPLLRNGAPVRGSPYACRNKMKHKELHLFHTIW
jgi:hypothetical protein